MPSQPAIQTEANLKNVKGAQSINSSQQHSINNRSSYFQQPKFTNQSKQLVYNESIQQNQQMVSIA